MNVENILKVADAIEKHEIKWLGFNMGTFLSSHGEVPDKSGHNCGTTACISGWAVAIKRGRVMCEWGWADDCEAAVFLGLSDQDAVKLFYPNRRLDRVKPDKAVAVLRHLAKTGKVDWSVKP